MLMLSKKVEYGLMALLHMDANNVQAVVSSKELAETHGLPVDLLGKVMQALARAGLIDAVHGAHGGYRLSSGLSAISLGQVIQAIEGPIKLVRCQHEAEDCGQFAACNIRDPLMQLHARLQDFIYGISLDQLRRDKLQAAVHE
jgi:Rrf2 family protein